VADRKLYVPGGRLGSFARNLPNHNVYDPYSGTWQAAADLPTPRSGNSADSVNAQTYVSGGEAVASAFDETERFTPLTGV